MKKTLLGILLSSLFLFAGCSSANTGNAVPTGTPKAPTSAESAAPEAATKASASSTAIVRTEPQKISQDKAKEMLDAGDNIMLVDVRTEEERKDGYIEGSILIPDYEISEKAEQLLPDKNQTILLYCRTGRRSAQAAQALANLGYTSVYDIGGIVDWPYGTVTD